MTLSSKYSSELGILVDDLTLTNKTVSPDQSIDEL